MTVAALAGVVGLTAAAWAAEPQAPSAALAVKRACEAAGGLAAFRRLGTLKLSVNRQEITQDGHESESHSIVYFRAPGPIPGRLEMPASKVVAADDGSGGWAVVAGHPDTRPGNVYMIKRLITTELFPILLPFSLTWDGAEVVGVRSARVEGKPVWQLQVEMISSFFHTPQISTHWTVDLDRDTFAVVRADSPATDLGKGIVADGMRFAWSKPTEIGGVQLPTEQRVIGLDEVGDEKSHNRIDRIEYSRVDADATTTLFINPIPPSQRPAPPVLRPPANGGGGGGH